MTKTEIQSIDTLLAKAVRELREISIKTIDALDSARQILAHSRGPVILPVQLKRALVDKSLPKCAHSRPLMDWSGEQLAPPCGCRLVEPSDEE